MPQQLPEIRSLIQALDEHSVRYVLIGGIALILHGGSQVTLDCDLAVSTDPDNATALVRALAPFQPAPSHAPWPEIFVWDERSIVGSVASLVTTVGDLDLFFATPGVDSFQLLYDASEERNLFGCSVRIASIEHLLAMKAAANRPKDLVHIMELEALRKLREESK